MFVRDSSSLEVFKKIPF